MPGAASVHTGHTGSAVSLTCFCQLFWSHFTIRNFEFEFQPNFAQVVGALIVLLGLYSFYRSLWFLCCPEGSFQTMTNEHVHDSDHDSDHGSEHDCDHDHHNDIDYNHDYNQVNEEEKLHKTFAMSFIMTTKLHTFLRLWDVWANTLNFDGVCSSIFIFSCTLSASHNMTFLTYRPT